MSTPEFDKEAVTMIGEKVVIDIDGEGKIDLATGEKIDTQGVVTLVQPANSGAVDLARLAVRKNLLKKIGVLSLSAGLGTAGAVAVHRNYFNDKDGPKSPDQAPVVTIPVVKENPVVAEIPKTSEELLKEIEKLNVKLDLDKFAQKNRYISGLMLTKAVNEKGASVDSWEAIDSKLFEEQVVLVFKLAKPEYKDLISFVGNQPVTSAIDKNDATILYVYFLCVPAKLAQKRGAAVVVKQGIKGKNLRDKYLASTDVTLPECK